MKKITLVILGILILSSIALYFMILRGIVKIDIFGSRTFYTGYVNIQTISLSDVMAKLAERGCHTTDYKGETASRCLYKEADVPYDKTKGIMVMPYGQGWGPIAFYVSTDKVWDTKDIPGSPDLNKFKDAVRRDLDAIGNILQINESTWKITSAIYPWSAIY